MKIYGSIITQVLGDASARCLHEYSRLYER